MAPGDSRWKLTGVATAGPLSYSLTYWRIASEAVMRLVVVLAAIACYLCGIVLSLFGPSFGWIPGIAAFLATIFLLLITNPKFRKGRIIPISATVPSVIQYRGLIWGAMILSAVVWVGAVVTSLHASDGAGVADGGPVFAERSQYLLNNHGTYTPVSRTRHLLVGTGFVLAWHSFGILVALFALHVILYGRGPLDFLDGNDSS